MKVRPMLKQDWQRVRAVTAQAFILPGHRLDSVHSFASQEGRVVTQGRHIEGVLRIERTEQFFGGQPVSSAGITAVAVPPESRGKGIGRILMREVLRELRDQEVAISTLFPTNVGFYRLLGYEVAGAFTQFKIPIFAAPRQGDLPVEPWTDRELAEVGACYEAFARQTSGLVKRSRSWWMRRVIATPPEQRVYRYLVRNKQGQITGYIVYSEELEPSSVPYSYSLVCRDFVWLDAPSARALWLLIASHPVLGISVLWAGPVDEPLSGFVHAQDIRVCYSARWMTRILNVVEALEARGYPALLSAGLELTISDPILSDNNRAIRLEVSSSRAKVTQIGRAGLTVDIAALAAMYTGWLSARDLVRADRVQNASPEEVATLEAIFSGPKPWTMEQF